MTAPNVALAIGCTVVLLTGVAVWLTVLVVVTLVKEWRDR